MEIGSMADWVAALAALAAAVWSARSLRIAQQANETADRAAADARERDAQAMRYEAEARQRELERDRRMLAGSLQGWWVAWETPGKTRWGVLLSNAGAIPSVFHDVALTVAGNRVSDVISVAQIPPGHFFVESHKPDKPTPWGLPEVVQDPTELTPLTRSSQHRVLSIEFTDQLGTRWCWTARRGLSPTAEGERPST